MCISCLKFSINSSQPARPEFGAVRSPPGLTRSAGRGGGKPASTREDTGGPARLQTVSPGAGLFVKCPNSIVLRNGTIGKRNSLRTPASRTAYGPPSTPSSAEDERIATWTRSPSRPMTTCLHSPPRCLTFGRTPLNSRLQFFFLHPSTCLLWLLSLRPTYAGSTSPLHRNPASLPLFLHPYCRM